MVYAEAVACKFQLWQKKGYSLIRASTCLGVCVETDRVVHAVGAAREFKLG